MGDRVHWSLPHLEVPAHNMRRESVTNGDAWCSARRDGASWENSISLTEILAALTPIHKLKLENTAHATLCRWNGVKIDLSRGNFSHCVIIDLAESYVLG